MASDLVDQLKSLHTRAIDALHGYEEALEQAEGHGLTSLFRDMIALHTRNASELSADLVGLGQQAGDDGSFMSVVHRAIMDVRSFFGGLGEGVLPGLIDGERRNMEAYDEVLRDQAMPAGIKDHLMQQRSRLEAAIAGMIAMKR